MSTTTATTTAITLQTVDDATDEHSNKRIVSQLPFKMLREIMPHLPRRKGRSWLFQYEDGMLVKISYDTRSGESAAMEYVRQLAPSVPVPEVHFTDFTNPEYGLIFMEEVPGETLEKVWPGLSSSQKEQTCRDIWDMIMTMRQLPRPQDIPAGECLYTTVDGSPLYPQGGLTGNEVAPLRKDQHDTDDALRAFILKRYRENWGPEPNMEDDFPRSETAVFTHGDIHPRNIMAGADGRVTSLLDFENAGFLPDYWEDVGMFMRPFEEWDRDWADTMMRTKPAEWDFEAQRAVCTVARRVLHF